MNIEILMAEERERDDCAQGKACSVHYLSMMLSFFNPENSDIIKGFRCFVAKDVIVIDRINAIAEAQIKANIRG